MVCPLPSATLAVRLDEYGALRVGDTRVLLDLVVHAFENGATCETIVDKYSSLSLADAYGAVAFYLQNLDYVHAYLAEREREAVEIRREIEANQPMTDVRRRLEARRAAQKEVATHAPRS